MSNKIAKLSDFALTENCRIDFDANFLKILDHIYRDVSMQDKINFLHQAQLTGADPRRNQIYLISYGRKATIAYSYHFLLSQANQTGEFENFKLETKVESVFNPLTGQTNDELVCTVQIFRKNRETVVHKARWSECFNSRSPQWKQRPYLMLEKSAIAAGLRWAFPEALSGMYIDSEIIPDNDEDIVIRDVSNVDEQAINDEIEKHETIITNTKENAEIETSKTEFVDLIMVEFKRISDRDGLDSKGKIELLKEMTGSLGKETLLGKTKKELQKILEKCKEK